MEMRTCVKKHFLYNNLYYALYLYQPIPN